MLALRRRHDYDTFQAIYQNAGYLDVGMRLAEKQPLHKRVAILERFHAQPLFMDDATMRRYITDVESSQDLLLSTFMIRLATMLADGADLMDATWLRHKVFPKIKEHFYCIKQRLDIVAALDQVDDAARDATIGRLMSPDVEMRLMQSARVMALGAADAMDGVRNVLLPPGARPRGPLNAAMLACTPGAVHTRRLNAEGNVAHE